MSRKKSELLLVFICFFLALLSISVLYLLFSKNYIEFIDWFLYKIHKPHLKQTASEFLSNKKFILLRTVAIVFSLLLYLVIFLIYKKRGSVINYTQLMIESFKFSTIRFVKNTIPVDKTYRILFYFLLLFYATRSIASIFYYPIDFDEADTYMLFSSQGPLVSASFYPLPNNHILFSILTSLTSLLPLDPILTLRLPLIPIGLLGAFSLFGLLKKFFKEQAALIGLSFYIASYPVFLYSSFARGYLLLLLFCTLSIYAILQITIFSKPDNRYYYLFALSSVLAFYTIPSFLYCFAGVCLFAFIVLIQEQKRNELYLLIKTISFISFATFIIYVPVFISLKWELLKPYMTPVYKSEETSQAFIKTLSYLSDFFLSPDHLLAILTGLFLVAGSVFVVVKSPRSNTRFILFVWLQFVLLLFIFFGLKQFSPLKPWMHLCIIITILLTTVINRIITWKTNLFLLTSILFFIIPGTIISLKYRSRSISHNYNMVAEKCEKLILNKRVKEVYADIPYFKTMIEYYAIKNSVPLSIYSSREKSHKFEAFDTLKPYDMIITYKINSKLPNLKFTYDTVINQNQCIVLLKRE